MQVRDSRCAYSFFAEAPFFPAHVFQVLEYDVLCRLFSVSPIMKTVLYGLFSYLPNFTNRTTGLADDKAARWCRGKKQGSLIVMKSGITFTAHSNSKLSLPLYPCLPCIGRGFAVSGPEHHQTLCSEICITINIYGLFFDGLTCIACATQIID